MPDSIKIEESYMTKEELKETLKEALDEEIKPFYIDREKHYQDHQFIDNLQSWIGNVGSATVKTTVTTIVSAVFLLLLFGFIFWGKKNF